MSTLREEILALAAARLDAELGPRQLPPLGQLTRDIYAHASEAVVAGPTERGAFLFFLGQVQALKESLLTENTQAVMAEGDSNGER